MIFKILLLSFFSSPAGDNEGGARYYMSNTELIYGVDIENPDDVNVKVEQTLLKF